MIGLERQNLDTRWDKMGLIGKLFDVKDKSKFKRSKKWEGELNKCI